MLAITAIAAFLVAPSVFAQSVGNGQANTGGVIGTVLDLNGHPVADATVLLEGNGSNDRHAVITKDDGAFAFRDLASGLYQISISAETFEEWTASVTVEAGQNKTLTDIQLRIEVVQKAVTVAYSPEQVATQQFKTEEQQRILRFIPNMYVVYDPHPEPLTTRRKFEMAYRDITHPTFFARIAAWAAVQQAADTLDYGQGIQGYGKRLGAGAGSGFTEGMIGNAILPSLLHQDPRYFYQGSGTKMSRAVHAILAPFVCRGDNGQLQPNYSTWGGSLAGAAIANTYYPERNRGVGNVFRGFSVGLALHVGSSLAQEFILDHFTSKGKNPGN